MKREFLEALGLDKEVVDKIMAEHGKTIQAEQSKLTNKDKELELANEQLTKANETIKSYKDMDIDKIKESAKDWETKFNEQKREMEDLKNSTALSLALAKTNAKNAEDLKHFLDLTKLKFNDGQIEGLEEQLKTLQEEKDYLFNPVEDNSSDVDPRFNSHEPPNNEGGNVSHMESTINSIFNNDF